jgi:hypothetical protein
MRQPSKDWDISAMLRFISRWSAIVLAVTLPFFFLEAPANAAEGGGSAAVWSLPAGALDSPPATLVPTKKAASSRSAAETTPGGCTESASVQVGQTFTAETPGYLKAVNWAGGGTVTCTPTMLLMQYKQYATNVPSGTSAWIAEGECAECSFLSATNLGYSCIQDSQTFTDCSGEWQVTKESLYEAPPTFTWTSASSGCVIDGQILECTKTATAGTASLFNGTPPTACGTSPTTGCVNIDPNMKVVPFLTEKAIDDIYSIHYMDIPNDIEPAYDKSAFYAGTTPSQLQSILLDGLKQDGAGWQNAASGYYEKHFSYKSISGQLGVNVGVKSELEGGGDTSNVVIVANGVTGEVVTMFPE